MANYKEAIFGGSEYVRCYGVEIRNPRGFEPHVLFQEERITVLPEREFSQAAGALYAKFDPHSVVPLINPETLEPTGAEMTMGDMYVALFSAYIQAAFARDVREANPPTPEPPTIPDSAQ